MKVVSRCCFFESPMEKNFSYRFGSFNAPGDG